MIELRDDDIVNVIRAERRQEREKVIEECAKLIEVRGRDDLAAAIRKLK